MMLANSFFYSPAGASMHAMSTPVNNSIGSHGSVVANKARTPVHALRALPRWAKWQLQQLSMKGTFPLHQWYHLSFLRPTACEQAAAHEAQGVQQHFHVSPGPFR